MTDGRRRRWAALPMVALTVLAGCATSSSPVQVAAATRSAAAPTWFLESGGIVLSPPPAPSTIGLSPVIPRPRAPEFVPPIVPPGVGVGAARPPAVCGGYGSPVQISPGAVPGPGTATISWQADGRPEVVGYRVQA